MSDRAQTPLLRPAASEATGGARGGFVAGLSRAVSADAWLPLGLALGAVLLAAGGAALNQRAATWLMRAEIEASARAWTAGLEAALGDELPALFDRRPPSDAARLSLEQARQVGDVFRYKLFDTRGALVLVSDDLSNPEGLRDTLASHRGGSAQAGGILAGAALVEVKRGEPPRRPSVYAEAYVPAHRHGKIVGVAEVYVDQTARHALYARVFLWVQAAVAGLVLLAGLPPALAAWRRTRQRRVAEAQVRFLAMHDSLTGLPNRPHFSGALSAALARRRQGGAAVAAIAVDLDRFKEVNDSLGHAAGDALLQGVATRLRAEVREGDVVARLGGDEFAVAQAAAEQPESAARLAERLVAALSEPFDLPGGHRVTCGASAGVAAAPNGASIRTPLYRPKPFRPLS